MVSKTQAAFGVLVVLFLAGSGGFGGLLGSTQPTGDVSDGGQQLACPTGTTLVNGVCTTPSGTQQTVSDAVLKLSPYDKYAPGPVLDIECVLSSNGTIAFDTGSASTATATRSPNEKLLVACWDDGQTTDISGTSITIDTSNDWYGYKEQITLPVKGTPIWPIDFQTSYVGNYKEAAWDGNFITNPDGTLNSASQLAVGSNGDKTVTITLSGPAKAAYGDPYAAADGVGMVFSSDFNTENWGTVEITEATLIAGTAKRIGEVQKVSVSGHRVGTDQVAYRLPYAALGQGDELALKLHFITKSDVNPSIDADINFMILDTSMYFDEEGTGFKYAVEDLEDDVDIGQTNFPMQVDIG